MCKVGTLGLDRLVILGGTGRYGDFELLGLSLWVWAVGLEGRELRIWVYGCGPGIWGAGFFPGDLMGPGFYFVFMGSGGGKPGATLFKGGASWGVGFGRDSRERGRASRKKPAPRPARLHTTRQGISDSPRRRLR